MDLNSHVTDVLQALDRAKSLVPQDWEYLAQDENVLMQVMEIEYNQKPLGVHLGIDKEIFPAAELLEDDEIKAIVDKILDVWAAYHYFAHLPHGLPIRIAYSTLLGVWDETVMCCPVGEFHFDFYDLELEQYVNPSYKKILTDYDLDV